MTLLDMNTVKLIGHQAERRRHWLSRPVPDRAEAEACMRRIDDILDRRPRQIAVDSDGEAVFSDASPWVKAQVDYVAPITEEEDVDHATGGGTALLERAPGDISEVLHPDDEAEIRSWRRKLHGL